MKYKNIALVRQRGFTLTELAIVLGIVGIVMSAIWVAAGRVYDNLRISKAINETLFIVEDMKNFYGYSHAMGMPANGSDITGFAINAGLVPADMVQSGVTAYLLGPWSGSQVNIYSGASWNAITVAFFNINEATCNRLSEAITVGNSYLDSGLVWESINGQSRTFPPFGSGSPFTPSDVSAACATNNGNMNVQVTYSVY